MDADHLVRWARGNRQGAPADDIRDPAVLVDVLRMLLAGHLERTEPQRVPDRTEIAPSGIRLIRGELPPPRTPLTVDETAREIAVLISYLEESKS